MPSLLTQHFQRIIKRIRRNCVYAETRYLDLLLRIRMQEHVPTETKSELGIHFVAARVKHIVKQLRCVRFRRGTAIRENKQRTYMCLMGCQTKCMTWRISLRYLHKRINGFMIKHVHHFGYQAVFQYIMFTYMASHRFESCPILFGIRWCNILGHYEHRIPFHGLRKQIGYQSVPMLTL